MPHKLKLHKCCKIHSNVFVTYALDLDLSLLSLLVLNTLLNNYPFLVARSPFISHFSLSPHHLYFCSLHFLPSEILPVLKFSLNKTILSPVLNLLIKLYLKIKKKKFPNQFTVTAKTSMRFLSLLIFKGNSKTFFFLSPI